MKDKEYYSNFENQRDEHTQNILGSESKNKIILAGPGTGKSYLFQQICKNNIENDLNNNLTLSFINELVNDLSKDLHGLSDVKTLHSFALKNISKNTNFFMNLGDEIQEVSFKDIFYNLEEEKEDELNFYSERRKFYNFFGPNCSIYT